MAKEKWKREKRRPPKNLMFSGVLAHLPGFEPGTFRLGGGRSILLSYKCIMYLYAESNAQQNYYTQLLR